MPHDYWPVTPAKALRDFRETRDSQAFEKLWEVYRTPVARYAGGIGLGTEAAEEVRQRVFISLAMRLRTFTYDATRSFRAYLKKVIRTHVNAYRAEHPARPQLTPDLLAWNEPETSHFALFMHEETLERIYAIVKARVKAKTWEAYWLIQHERVSRAEAARRLDWLYIQAYRAHARVVAMLRQEAEREGGGAR